MSSMWSSTSSAVGVAPLPAYHPSVNPTKIRAYRPAAAENVSCVNWHCSDARKTTIGVTSSGSSRSAAAPISSSVMPVRATGAMTLERTPAARCLDLVDALLRGRVRAAFTVDRPAEVVDDDARAAACQLQRVGASEAATGAGDDRDPTVEGDLSHAYSSHRAVPVKWGYRTA